MNVVALGPNAKGEKGWSFTAGGGSRVRDAAGGAAGAWPNVLVIGPKVNDVGGTRADVRM